MSTTAIRDEVPFWAVLAGLALLVVSLAYSVVVRASVSEWAMVWLGVGRVALSLFVVYLLYRFVLAVEKIADKL